MALTRITKGVIKPNENYDTHNINSTGIITAVGANFSGNVSVGGVLTYEDVTNIDSVGIITARQGIFIDDSITHIGDTDTKIRFPANNQISLETNGSQRLIVGTSGNITVSGQGELRIPNSLSHVADTDTKIRFPAADNISFETAGSERLRITSDGRIGINDSTPNDYELDIQKRSGVTDANIRLYNSDTTSTSDTIMRYQIGGTTANNYIYFGDSADVNAGQIRYSHSNDFLSVHTNAAERLRIASDGEVGIGTITPNSLLHLHQSSTSGFDGLRLTNSTTGVSATSGFTIGLNDVEEGRIWHYGNESIQFGVDNELHGTLRQDGRWCLGPNQTSGSHVLNVFEATGPSAQFHSNSDAGISIKDDSDDSDVEITNNNGQLTIDLDHSGQVTTEAFIIKKNGGSGGTEELFRIKSNGNVGIGTVIPDHNLHVYQESGDAVITIESTGNGNHSALEFIRTSSGGDNKGAGSIYVTGDTSTSAAKMKFGVAHNISHGVYPKMTIDGNNGFVGIGTENPVRPLHIEDADCRIRLTDDGHATDVELSNVSGDAVLTTNGASNLRLQTNNTERLRIDSNGDIYTSNDQVRGDARLTIEKNKVGVSTAIFLHNSNGSGTASKISSSKSIILSADVEANTGANGSFIAFETDNTEKVRIANNGFVGIGTNVLESKLTVGAASASAIIEIKRTSLNSTGAIGALNFTAIDGHSVANIIALGDGDNEGAHLLFKTTSASAENSPYASGTTERLRITSNGNVGINTNDPKSRLDLRGDLNINNNTIISNFDSNGIGGSNIDHIWHSDAGNYGRGGTWHFVSDTTYKATGNSVIQIGYLSCSGGAHFAANNVAIGLTTVSRGPLHVHNNSGEDCQIHMTNNETGTTSNDGLTIFTDTDTSGMWSRENVPLDIATANVRSLRVHNTGGLSINTTSKSTDALLHIDNHGDRNTISDVSNASQYVIVNDCHFGGSGGTLTANRAKAGIRNDIEFTSTTPSTTASGNRFSVYGIYTDIAATKFAYVTDGIYSFVKSTADNQPSSNGTATIRGIYGYAQGYCTNSQANVNIYGGYFLGYRGGDVNAGHCYGVYARAHNTNGTNNTGDLTGVYSEWEQDDASTITNAYCFRGYGDRDAGTITNGYILSGSFGGDGSITNRWGVYISDSAKNRLGGELTVTGDLVVNGSSKQFRIPHPIVGLSTTKDLVHAAIEGPQIDLIYRGKVDLVNGTATVNLDTKSRMTEGTFVLLNRDVQCFTTNETGWTNVKGSVTGNQLTIIAQENTCTDTISWMVIGERQDDAVKQSTSTNDNGKLIMEPLKEILPDADFEQPECEKNIYNEE